MPRVAAIHQPEHLPWLGFFAKMACADLLILLDTVPFRKNYYQNRNRVLGPDGRPLWLTVPVRLERHLDGRILDVAIAAEDGGRWRRKYLRTLEQSYARHPRFRDVYPEIAAEVAGAGWDLAGLNVRLIEKLRAVFGIDTPLASAAAMGGRGTRSDLLADLCARAGADVYLAGPFARAYLDPEPFRRLGIAVRIHDYEHPRYPQSGTAGEFVSHLSAADLAFNLGKDGAGLLRSGSRVGPFVPAPAPGPRVEAGPAGDGGRNDGGSDDGGGAEGSGP